MINASENSKRIAKNTLVLYVRMLFSMLVTLYTSRIVLDVLGEVNYGIYNVVGGVVPMLAVFTNVLSSAISRFITFELGTGNQERLKRIFSTSVNIQFIIALVGFVLCEVGGVWFLNEKMNIPAERMEAAHFVLQCSIVSFMIAIISVPYNAVIVAHEKMNAFAYISIFEVLMKLLIAYLIYISPIDTLKLYAALLLALSLLMRIIYGVYCERHFTEAKYHFLIDQSLLKKMFSFAGWNFLGRTVYVLNGQGVNMLINIFFGVTTNAAQAIASQVNSAVSQFVNNFCLALNPQIIKSYASKDYEFLYKLIIWGTKFTFFIMYLLTLPIILEVDIILKLWLNNIPPDTIVYIRLVLMSSLLTLLGNSMFTAIMATGDIRRYQTIATTIECLAFPLIWIGYKMGYPAYFSYIMYGLVYFSINVVRLYTLKRLIYFPVRLFYTSVFIRIVYYAVLAFIFPLLITILMPSSFIRFLLVCLISFLGSIFCMYFIGLDKSERTFFLSRIMVILNKRFHCFLKFHK